MKSEKLSTMVALGSGNEVELEIEFKEDALSFYVDDELVFSGDWVGNFREMFERALVIWPHIRMD